MAADRKIWLITGASRGLGSSLARQAAARGDRVIGTTRDVSRWNSDSDHSMQMLPLEMTDAAAVRETVAQAHALHGHLDVIVNNAGYGLLGALEEASEDEVKHLFDVNFHGTRRIIQAALPFLRAQKSGHIVNITSIAGLAPSAGAGLYAASKFAVEGLSQSLAQEVAPLGIKVTIVEPGAFRTDFLSSHSIRNSRREIADYSPTAGATRISLAQMAGKQLGNPECAAAAIIAVVDAAEPPLHLLLGSDALRRVREKHARFNSDIERWHATTLGTDFEATR